MPALASLRKILPFRLGVVLPIVCAALVALFSPAPAAAQLQACNNTKYKIVFVYSRTWVTEVSPGKFAPAVDVSGWFTAAPGQCGSLMNAPIFDYSFYFYAMEVGNPKQAIWSGNVARCVASNQTVAFTYSGAQASPPCPAGQMQVKLLPFKIPTDTNGVPTQRATFYFNPGPNG